MRDELIKAARPVLKWLGGTLLVVFVLVWIAAPSAVTIAAGVTVVLFVVVRYCLLTSTPHPLLAALIGALAPQLPGPLLQRALEAPLMIRDEWERAKALVVLAPQLPDEPRAVALQQSLEAAPMIQDEGWRAQVLRVLAPQLSGPLLQYGLEATRKNEMWRMWVPAALFSRRSDLAPMLPSVRYALANHLLTLKDRRRRDVLMFCATESLFTPPILSPATVSLIAAHIAEICQEWRWL